MAVACHENPALRYLQEIAVARFGLLVQSVWRCSVVHGGGLMGRQFVHWTSRGGRRFGVWYSLLWKRKLESCSGLLFHLAGLSPPESFLPIKFGVEERWICLIYSDQLFCFFLYNMSSCTATASSSELFKTFVDIKKEDSLLVGRK